MTLIPEQLIKELEIEDMEITPVPKTVSGNIYEIGGNMFLKIAKNEGQRLDLHKEVLILEELTNLGIAVPHVLKVSRDLTALLTKELDGTRLGKAMEEMTVVQQQSIYFKLGVLLAELHINKFDYFGNILVKDGDLSLGVVFRDFWSYINGLAVEYVQSSKGTILQPVMKRAYQIFESSRDHFDEIDDPEFIHADLHGLNIFVDGDSITGILDLDTCESAHGELELARIRFTHFKVYSVELNTHLESGYFSIKKKLPGFEQRSRILDVLMFMQQVWRMLNDNKYSQEKYLLVTLKDFNAFLDNL